MRGRERCSGYAAASGDLAVFELVLVFVLVEGFRLGGEGGGGEVGEVGDIGGGRGGGERLGEGGEGQEDGEDGRGSEEVHFGVVDGL